MITLEAVDMPARVHSSKLIVYSLSEAMYTDRMELTWLSASRKRVIKLDAVYLSIIDVYNSNGEIDGSYMDNM